MKPTNLALLLALVLSGCGPLHNLQKVESRIPCIGSLGKHHTKLFSKSFQKVGEPMLQKPVALALEQSTFTSGEQSKYDKYLESQGLESTQNYSDSTLVPKKYYQVRISDVVGLKAQLNSPANKATKDYLKEDKDVVLLSGISFVTNERIEQQIFNAEHYYISEIKGELTLELRREEETSHIPMSALKIFDFETAGFCWKRNKKNQLEIATISMDGNSCPGNAEKDPNKLDATQTYLKL